MKSTASRPSAANRTALMDFFHEEEFWAAITFIGLSPIRMFDRHNGRTKIHVGIPSAQRALLIRVYRWSRQTGVNFRGCRITVRGVVAAPRCMLSILSFWDGPPTSEPPRRYAARTESRNLPTSSLSRLLSPDSDCAAESTCEEAEPLSDAPRCTSVMLAATCWVPCAAC